jgi:hypothetical protein
LKLWGKGFGLEEGEEIKEVLMIDIKFGRVV